MVAGARNLAIAERKGADILTVCSGCFGTLHGINSSLRDDPQLRNRINNSLEKLGYSVEGKLEVRHIAQTLGYDIGPYDIEDYIVQKVKLKAAIHHGCHFLRPFDEKQIDDPDNPMILEEYFAALGVESVEFTHKYTCCGAGGGVKAGFGSDSLKMLGEKLQAIQSSGAEVILDICPFCHLQFDSGQKMVNEKYGCDFNIPVIHISQLTAFAMGLNDIGLKYQVTAPEFNLEVSRVA
jgi:heterodisulfide reductase subunit B